MEVLLKMKKLVLICVLLTALTGTAFSWDRQDKERIVVAYSFCADNCRDDLQQCKRNCNYLSGLLYDSCVDDCMNDYDRCVRRCER